MSKIISLTDRSARTVNRGSERRRAFRHPGCERLIVQIVACGEPEMIGTTVSCSTANISLEGMKIVSETYIPNGSQLDIWLDLASHAGKLFLCSEVRWSRMKADRSYELGVELRLDAATDIEEWRRVNARAYCSR